MQPDETVNKININTQYYSVSLVHIIIRFGLWAGLNLNLMRMRAT